MILRKTIYITSCMAALFCFAAFNRAFGAESFSDLKLDANRVPWTQLSFHAKNFWVEVSTNIELRSLQTSDVEALLLKSPRGGPIKPTTPQAYQITINTTIDPVFRSPVNIYNRIWFNQADAAALGRVRLRRGEDDFKKTYRFTNQGVFRYRMEPKDKKEASLEPKQWTNVKDSFYPYDMNRLKCAGVTERSLLIYILSAAATSKFNNALSLCVFGKRQLHRVKLQNAGVYPIKVNYIEERQQAKIRRQGIVQTLKVTLSSEPLESDLKAAENFSFLGFHKSIAIYIDPATHLPIQASGIIPTIGKAHLKLREAHINR